MSWIHLTENGGGMTSRGSATVVAMEDGTPGKSTWKPRPYCNGVHAEFNLHDSACGKGVYEVHAVHSRGDGFWSVEFFSTNVKDPLCGKLVASGRITYDNFDTSAEFDGWLDEHPAELLRAVKAAFDKATCYHCRSIFYAL